MKTLHTLGSAFHKRHAWLIKTAKACEVALCGGCAAAATKGITDYVPKDIDFAATQENAIKFIGMINGFMLARSVHYRIYANSQNKFVPSQATAHFRITCGFWLPVCLFVLPDDKFRAYRIRGGHFLQFYTDIKEAADELTEMDSKPRIANQPEDAEPEPTAAGITEEELSRHQSPDWETQAIHDLETLQDSPIGSRARTP